MTPLALALVTLVIQGQAAPSAAEKPPEAVAREDAETRRLALTHRIRRACAALEAGAFERAREALSEGPATWGAVPPPEVRLLGALIALRRDVPELGWRDAFLDAWRAVGRPDLREATFLPPPAPDSPAELERAWARKPKDETRFLLALAMEPDLERARFLVQHLAEVPAPEYLVSALAYLENTSFPESLRDEATASLRTRLGALAAASPDTLHFGVLALLIGTRMDAPFTAGELRELQALSIRPRWRQTDLFSLYQHARLPLEAAGLSQGWLVAYGLALNAVGTPAHSWLQQRTQASQKTLSSEDRVRLGESLWRIGERLDAENTLLEHMLALGLMKRGASVLGDLPRQERVTALSTEERKFLQDYLRVALDRWPLPSLQKAMLESSLRDERAYMRAFRESSTKTP